MVTGAYAIAVTYAQQLPGDRRRPLALALHAHLGRHPGAAADHHPPLPAGVAGMAARRRPPARCKRPSTRRHLHAAAASHHHRHDLMFACAYGAAFGAIQQMPRIVPGLPEVRTLAAAAAAADGGGRAGVPGSGRAGRTLRAGVPRAAHRVAAVAGARVPDSRSADRARSSSTTRPTPASTSPGGACSSPGSSPWPSSASGGTICRASIPRTCAGTGEGFAANIGGRMLGTGFAFVTTQLTNIMPGATPPMRLAYAVGAASRCSSTPRA